MVESIEGLPDGVLGYRIWGELSREEYDAVLKPALDAAVATGARSAASSRSARRSRA